MLSYDDALRRMLSHAHPLPSQDTALADALNQVLTTDVLAPVALPPFANSQMDGYAVRFRDLANGSHALPVAGTIAAGRGDVPPLPPGTAFKIMTGAMLPPDADTVVPIEDTDGGGETVIIQDAGESGQFVRPAGEDAQPGDLCVSAGTVLRPMHLGLLAALGLARVSVHRAPRVAILSTGDELVMPGQSLASGQIYNSNYYALAAQVVDSGGIVHALSSLAPIRDTPEALRAAFDAAEGADVVIASGGVSVGEFDHVKAVWQERGTLDFWRVAIRPGKPLAFGLTENGTLFFGLPGNPVSAFVTFELFVRPVLLALRGLRNVSRPLLTAALSTPASHEPGRRSFQRGRAEWDGAQWTATPLSGQGSHRLRTAADANALLVLAEDQAHWNTGDSVPLLML